MNDTARIGVFLCECGNQIAPLIDLAAVTRAIGAQPGVEHCDVLPFSCMQPGIEQIMTTTAKKRLNRIIVAGCEGRLMLKKLEVRLAPLELFKGQIDMVNLRGHVATASDLGAKVKAQKAIKLIRASVAEMNALRPSPQVLAQLTGPVVITGGGVASYTAAQQLAAQGVDFVLTQNGAAPETVIGKIHWTYPGERQYYNRLKKIVAEALASPHATVLPTGRLIHLAGVTGDYTLTFEVSGDKPAKSLKATAIIACLDAQLLAPGPEFGHDGQTVMIQPEMEEWIGKNGPPKNRVAFWINDYETGQEKFAHLSARSAWNMACHIRQSSKTAQTVILYNAKMPIPLSGVERRLNHQLNIAWVPYDPALRPTIQDGVITFCNLTDHVEHELPWDTMVLSPVRALGGEALHTAEVLGLVHKHGRFLTGHHARVRPEMLGREETYLAGSARFPCDLHSALAEGRRAGSKTATMMEKAAAHQLYVPRIVCVVDPTKCVGCGQCEELCDCGGIGVADGLEGGLPRVVDPMVCTGGGTCAASCPYHALVLQNNSNDQREAKVAELARQLGSDEVMAIGCVWGGVPAADNAGKQGLKYDPRLFLLSVPCVGQIDPCVMARAFLEGAPGLLLIGCLPEACHHSYGVDHTWSRVNVIKKLLAMSGFERERIALAHADLNKPEEFVTTVESFVRTIASIGPINQTPENQEKLQILYDLIKNNTRVRHLLSAGLRRPWEDIYRGDQRHALDYDRDFSAVLAEEMLQHRLIQVLKTHRQPMALADLARTLGQNKVQVAGCLQELITDGVIHLSHKNREAFYNVLQ